MDGAVCSLRPERAGTLITEALYGKDPGGRNSLRFWIALKEGHELPIEACLLGFTRKFEAGSRCYSGALMRRHGEQGMHALWDTLRTGTPDQRATAAVTLADQASTEPFDGLIEELVSGYQEKQWSPCVARTLVHHYRDKFAAWAETEKPDTSDRPYLAWALAQLHLAQGAGPADDLLRQGTPSIRAAALRKLAGEQGAEFLPELRRCLRAGRPRKVAQEAFWQMYRLGDAAMSAAQDMCHTHSD